ncbi:hypothetical protein IT568_04775 [bacterium]|nr:hypothetical protein [bacterium]
MFTLFGFILWDRKSVTKPLAKDIKDVSEELYQLKSALREFSRQEPKIFEALKKTGIL